MRKPSSGINEKKQFFLLSPGDFFLFLMMKNFFHLFLRTA